ncbi:MAG: sulfurtransferase TusA family protein [Pseudomonadota bacterium]
MQIANATLDARGLNCPLPILKTKKELTSLTAGETLMMLSSDPGSVKDIESFCLQTGNELLESAASDNEFSFLIRKV